MVQVIHVALSSRDGKTGLFCSMCLFSVALSFRRATHNSKYGIFFTRYDDFLISIAIFTIANTINTYSIMTETVMLNRIKVALAERQKTSKWLAEQLKKSETTVSRWASNKVQPSVEQLFEIAGILEMDVKDLLSSNMNGALKGGSQSN